MAFFLWILTAMPVKAQALQEPVPYELLPDSSNFVIASILIADPGDDAFFVLGHCALRLQCPTKDMDYCFSYNTSLEMGPEFNLHLLTGRAKAGYEPLSFNRYLEPFQDEQRGMREYVLNLTLDEKRMLWQQIDKQVAKGPTMPFDYIFNNCTNTLYRVISSTLQNEDFEYHDNSLLDMLPREYCELLLGQRSPWIYFMAMSLMSGVPNDSPWPLTTMINPIYLDLLLPEATIRGNDGSVRPALEEPVRTVLLSMRVTKPSAVTPFRLFLGLLVVVLLVTWVEKRFHVRWPAKAVDVLLATGYTLFSLMMLVVSVTKSFGASWNWLFITFNPLPLLLWLCYRKKPWYGRVWGVYAVAIVVTMVLFSLILRHMEWAHEFLLAALLTRCVAHYANHSVSNNHGRTTA